MEHRMATRQTKLTTSKVVVPSPAQPSKLPASGLPAPPPSLTATEFQAPPTIQAPPEMLTLKDLQAALSSMTDGLEKRFEQLENKMDKQNKSVTDELEKIKETIQTYNMEIREDMVEAFKGVMESVEEKVDEVEQQVEGQFAEMKSEMMSEIQDHALMVQYNQMLSAIRIRGLREVPNENQDDLRKILEEALVKFLDIAVQNFSWQIDRIYRVNSWIAKTRNLPRDVVIYFVTRRLRNLVLTTSYNKQLSVAGQEVLILKEIPPKMLRARKDYAFLVAELKIRALQFRWEVPAGLSLFYNGNRYRLNSVWKAKEFFENVLKAGRPPSPTSKSVDLLQERETATKQQPQSSELQLSTATGGDKGALMEIPAQRFDIFQPLEIENPKAQRQTRVTKWEQQGKQQQGVTCLEAMGARPKKKMGEKVDLALQKLSKGRHVK